MLQYDSLLTVSVLPLEMSFSLTGESRMLATLPAELDTLTTLAPGLRVGKRISQAFLVDQ